MPAPELSGRLQKATLWESLPGAVGRNDYGVAIQATATPVEIMVRWEEQQGDVSVAQGDSAKLDATVVTDRRIPLGSLLWLGELADWYGTGSNDPDNELMLVTGTRRVPDLKNRFAFYRVALSRFRGTRPVTA